MTTDATPPQVTTDQQAALVEAVQMRIAGQRLKLQQKAGKLKRTSA
jgi:hypothetical protein